MNIKKIFFFARFSQFFLEKINLMRYREIQLHPLPLNTSRNFCTPPFTKKKRFNLRMAVTSSATENSKLLHKNFAMKILFITAGKKCSKLENARKKLGKEWKNAMILKKHFCKLPENHFRMSDKIRKRYKTLGKIPGSIKNSRNK